MIGIVISRADVASETIGEQLRAVADWETRTDETRDPAAGGGTYYRREGISMRTFEELHLYLDRVAEAFDDPSVIVVASRHSGDTGPLLSAHHTGNFGAADYGGEPRTLAVAAPNVTAAAIDALQTHAPDPYDVSLECTHHGPTTVGAPSLFIELGSDEAQWRDPEGAEAVARAILSLSAEVPDRERTVIGIGGNHYAPRCTRIVTETDWALGHIAADWSLEAMGEPDPALVEAMFEQSGAERVVFDGEHPAVAEVIERLGYERVSETWLKETTGVSLAAVEHLESAVGAIDDGTRLGVPAREWDPTDDAVQLITLPNTLLEAVQGIDRERTRQAVERTCLAYRTSESGTVIEPTAAIRGADATTYGLPTELLDALLDILGAQYDRVRREGGTIIAERETFDPEAAAKQGVPEGPKFGQLANGHSVEVDGKQVDPESVRRTQRERFDLR